MSDLPKQLRKCALDSVLSNQKLAEETYYWKAADEIEQLEQQLNDLRAACEQKQEIINSFDAVDKARREENNTLKQQLSAHRWIPVSDEWPPFDIPVLVKSKHYPDAITAAILRWEDDGWYWEEHYMGWLTDVASYECDDEYEYSEWKYITPPESK